MKKYKFIDTLEIKQPTDFNLSYSKLKAFNKSPIDFLIYLNRKYEMTDSMLKGKVVDCLLLTPDNFEKEYIVVDNFDRRTKQGKEMYAKFSDQAQKENKTLVKQSMFEECSMMCNSIHDNTKASKLLMHTDETQYPINFKYKLQNFKEHYYNVRGFADGVGVLNDKPFIFDLKTTNNINQHYYTRQIIDMLYHLQASIYVRGYYAEWLKKPDFYHIVVENSAPYKVNVFKFNNDFIENGKQLFKKLVMYYDHCRVHDFWHKGQDYKELNHWDKIEEINVPEWYQNI